MSEYGSVTVLGSGTSTGVPVVGCDCEVCVSKNTKNQRSRASILLKDKSGELLVVDTGPDFRTQALAAGIRRLRHVFYTHIHADHCHGFDDLRAFYFHSGQSVTCHVPRTFEAEFRSRFRYAFENTGYQGTAPQVEIQPFEPGPLHVGPFSLEVAMFPHGNVHTAGFRWGRFAYVTDFKSFPNDVMTRWAGSIDVMVASGNNFDLTHPTHSTVQETAEIMQKLGVKRGAIGHLSHDVDYRMHNSGLPEGVELAYDGMSIDLTR
jgi:phosphoribosyl 1,2-cyclic phosphate phosphodiesterase